MNRRNLLRGLGALPIATGAAVVGAAVPQGKPLAYAVAQPQCAGCYSVLSLTAEMHAGGGAFITACPNDRCANYRVSVAIRPAPMFAP